MLIEVKLLNYLKSKITDVPVYSEMPAAKPSEYVLFEKTGHSQNEHIETATFAIRSVAPSLMESVELDHMVIKAMEEFDEVVNVSSVQLNADANWTNTTTKEHRQQAVFLITYMED